MPKAATIGRFERADKDVKHRLIGASYGEQGTGKTHFWLSAPGPIYVQSFDFGLEGVIQKFQQEKEIYLREYDWTPGKEGLDWGATVDLRDQFIEDFELALKKGRTVIWDKETEVWELFRYAQFGEKSDAPRNYPELNQRYRYYIRRPYDLGVNFGLIQGVREKWVSKPDKKTGELKPHNTGELVRTGFGELGSLVQVDIWHKRANGCFTLDVGKCRQNPDLQDEQFTNLSFADLAMLVFPESGEKNWS